MTNSGSQKSHLRRSKTSLQRRKKSESTDNDATEQRKLNQDSKQEEKYKSLVESIPCAVYSAFPGETGPTTFMSKNWNDWTGYSAEELYQDPEAWPKCIFPDDREKATNAYFEACRNEASYNLEYRIVHRDTGQVRYVRDQGLPRKDTKGTLIRVDGIITDITDLKTSENELVKYQDHLEELVKDRTAELEKANEVLKLQDKEHKKAEEKLRQYDHIVSSSTDMLALLDKRFVYMAANSSYLKAFGKTPDEVIGHTVSEVFGKEFFETVIKPNAERCLAGEEVNYQAWFDFPAYKPRYMDINYYPYIDSNNEVLGFVVNGRNITGRKKAEEALQKSEHRYRTLVEANPYGIQEIDTSGIITYTNPAYQKILGYTEQELLSMSILDLLEPESRRDELRNYLSMLVKEQPLPITYFQKNRTKENRVIDMAIDWNYKRDNEGHVVGFTSVITDITEQKKAEQKVLDDQAQLKSLASQLSLIEERERHRLATELHDQIGQSLVFSKIKLDQLRESALSGELTEVLEEVCDCLGQVIRDMRTLTFDLSYPILYELGFESAVSEWLDERLEGNQGIKTEFVDDGQVKPLDDDIRALLFRNVRELLVNVIKHAKASKVKISICRLNEYLHIDIEDDGVGFDSVRVASTAAKETKFGLFSIRQRLEQLGGHLEIDSEKGCGSKITMT
ncbi:MAG: sensor histidine kinase, partial [Planctomycetota bacterium]